MEKREESREQEKGRIEAGRAGSREPVRVEAVRAGAPDYDKKVAEGGDDDADCHGHGNEHGEEHAKRSRPAGRAAVLRGGGIG